MNFLKIIFWEYVQNLPILAGFIWAYAFWQQDKIWLAMICILAGSITGAVLIALTEKKKVTGHREPAAVVAANITGMTAIMCGLVAYLSADWSGWLTDLLAGALGGAGLGAVQSLAAKEKIGLRHCIALGLASPLALISIRLLLSIGWPVWLNILSISLLATLIISLVDYLPGKLQSTRLN